MVNRKPKIIGKHSTQRDLMKSNTIEHDAKGLNQETHFKNYLTHSFKSTIFENRYFVDSKTYLLACLTLYLLSIFLVDYFSDSAAFFIRNELMNVFNRDHGFFILKRFFLWDVVVQIGFLVMFVAVFIRVPSLFFCFNGYKKFDEESLWISFLRVFASCIVISLSLMALLSTTQGLLYWLPEWVYTLCLQLNNPQWVTKAGWAEQKLQIEQYHNLVNPFNFSLIFIFLIRSGIITTILQGLLLRDKRFKLTKPVLILAVLLPLILGLSYFIKPQQYKGATEIRHQNEEIKDENHYEYRYKHHKKVISQNPSNQEQRPKYYSIYNPMTGQTISNSRKPLNDGERPKAYISIYDSTTGQTISNH